MADIANKYAENVSGKFYVDDQCIDCDLCRETAPANFTRIDDGGYSYVFKQPLTPEEEALCKEAMEGCARPVSWLRGRARRSAPAGERENCSAPLTLLSSWIPSIAQRRQVGSAKADWTV